MRDGFVRVAVATPEIKVADCVYNAQSIIAEIKKAAMQKVKLLVLPELCVTGYTCEDLFLQRTLLTACEEAVKTICAASENLDVLVVFGMPFEKNHHLYNVAVVMKSGKILGIVPKIHLPNYAEFYEARHFEPAPKEDCEVTFLGQSIPFGTHIVFSCAQMRDFVLGVEICEDLWVAEPPSGALSRAGATVIANPSASDETTGKAEYRRQLITGQSARTITAYLYADAGEGESTTDLVFAGHNLIAENGILLAETERFQNSMAVTEIDVARLAGERRRMHHGESEVQGYRTVVFSFDELSESMEKTGRLPEITLTRAIDRAPFVPADERKKISRCKEIIQIQAMGLKQRLIHTGAKRAVVGISGGLDSTLALLVTCRAFELAGLDKSGILSVTMPCFGTTDRTYQNACRLTKELGATLKEVVIKDAVRVHFKDIGQDESCHDVTYENSQARERTQVLMDLANQIGGMVIGTGDMSELALGWATYNGDHMSMYGVNASVPKTLVRYLVSYFAGETDNAALRDVLCDILDTPVSPELLPPKDGEIAQKTEDLVGPYELHDFFLYYVLRCAFAPGKIYRLARLAFDGEYEDAVILKWLKVFYRRFFSQQFKRSCLPDGPKVGSVAVSPRGDLRMPSDACAGLWLDEIESLKA